MRIQHNIMAMNAYRNYTNNVSAMKKNLEKLSSGYKINRAGDDAAGLAISEKMRAQITGLETAQKNAKDGISLVQTAEGALTEVHDMLNRMVTLATQSANGTYDNETDRDQLQKELDQLRSEIDRIADSSNFNGIKLLDGSLATSGTAATSNIKVAGNATAEYSTGAAGKFSTTAAIAGGAFTGAASAAEGDSFEFGVTLQGGEGYAVKLTMKKASDDTYYLEGGSGAKYKLTTNGATNYQASLGELLQGISGELQKTGLADKYAISVNSTTNGFEFTAKEEGTSVPAVLAVDYALSVGGTYTAATGIGLKVETTAVDAGFEINADKLTEYNGKNYDDAVFTINGKKFVILTSDHDGDTLGVTGTAMNATLGLDSSVTVLVGGKAGLKKGDDNFDQNCQKISEVTGLSAGDTIAGDGNTIAAAGGIRLTAGKESRTGGLVLQIGDTADSYNQLRVGINDCHTKAMGIANISIADQSSAADAVDIIKKAINYVSDVRGTLGATQNRLDHTINNLSVMQENIQDAESTIRDTDVAAEMMAYTKNNILIQSAQAMLAQANQVPQGVLQLLQ